MYSNKSSPLIVIENTLWIFSTTIGEFNSLMSFLSNTGNLSEYLMRNSSLLQSYPTELENIMNHVINGMVYLHECRVVHGELVSTKVCLR